MDHSDGECISTFLASFEKDCLLTRSSREKVQQPSIQSSTNNFIKKYKDSPLLVRSISPIASMNSSSSSSTGQSVNTFTMGLTSGGSMVRNNQRVTRSTNQQSVLRNISYTSRPEPKNERAMAQHLHPSVLPSFDTSFVDLPNVTVDSSSDGNTVAISPVRQQTVQRFTPSGSIEYVSLSPQGPTLQPVSPQSPIENSNVFQSQTLGNYGRRLDDYGSQNLCIGGKL